MGFDFDDFDYEGAVYDAADQMEKMEQRRYEAERVYVALNKKDNGTLEVEMWKGDESIRTFFEIETETGAMRNFLNAEREAVSIPPKDGKDFMESVTNSPEEEFVLANKKLVREEVYAYYEGIGKRIAGNLHHPNEVDEPIFE